MLDAIHRYFRTAADVVGLDSRLREIILAPRRVVKVDLVTESDDGQLMHHQGFRVQHNDARGPFKGGLRYHPTVDEDHAAALANLMTWKTVAPRALYWHCSASEGRRFLGVRSASKSIWNKRVTHNERETNHENIFALFL